MEDELAIDDVDLAATVSFGATIVLGLFTMVCDIVSGVLSDIMGRKPVMLVAASAMAILAVPLYAAIVRFPGVAMIYGVMAALSILNGMFCGPSLISITESLPKSIRSGALGTLYAVAMAIFGGSTQVMVKWLIDVTGSPLAPAWYLAGAMGLGVIAMALMRETAPAKTGVVLP